MKKLKKEQNKLITPQKTKSRFSWWNAVLRIRIKGIRIFLVTLMRIRIRIRPLIWCGSESYFSLSPDPAPHQSDEICHHWHTDPPRIRIPLLTLCISGHGFFTLIRIQIQLPKMMRICNRNRIQETDAMHLIIWWFKSCGEWLGWILGTTWTPSNTSPCAACRRDTNPFACK